MKLVLTGPVKDNLESLLLFFKSMYNLDMKVRLVGKVDDTDYYDIIRTKRVNFSKNLENFSEIRVYENRTFSDKMGDKKIMVTFKENYRELESHEYYSWKSYIKNSKYFRGVNV